MKIISCTKCGSNALEKTASGWVCPYCGTKYDVSDSSSSISINEDIERLLQKCKEEPWNKRRYANLILDIDPTNHKALAILEGRG